MLSTEEKNAIIALIHQEVIPAIGCTEPMAVALCVAKATEILGTRPEQINLRLSTNTQSTQNVAAQKIKIARISLNTCISRKP